MLGKEYHDLADLLLNNDRAKHFYKGLPDNVKQVISHNGDDIRSMNALRHFAKTASKTEE